MIFFQALNILQQAKSLQVPSVDHVTVEQQAVKMNNEAKAIQEEARELIALNEELLRDAQDKRAELEDLLRRAERQQQQVDAQLADMDGFKTRAFDAVESGNRVLEDAQDTLRTLQDFETRVAENQENARVAIDNAAAIQDMVRMADEKVGNARSAMEGADTSASLALTVALDAQRIAEEASEKAAAISSESGEALEQAKELSSSAQSLADKLATTKEDIIRKEEVAKVDGESALQVYVYCLLFASCPFFATITISRPCPKRTRPRSRQRTRPRRWSRPRKSWKTLRPFWLPSRNRNPACWRSWHGGWRRRRENSPLKISTKSCTISRWPSRDRYVKRKTSQINVKMDPRMSNAIRHTKQVYLLSHYEREVSRL